MADGTIRKGPLGAPVGYRYRRSDSVYTVVGYFEYGVPGGDRFDHLVRHENGGISQTTTWWIKQGQPVDERVERRSFEAKVVGGRARHVEAQEIAEANGVPTGFLPVQVDYDHTDDSYTLYWEWVQPIERTEGS